MGDLDWRILQSELQRVGVLKDRPARLPDHNRDIRIPNIHIPDIRIPILNIPIPDIPILNNTPFLHKVGDVETKDVETKDVEMKDVKMEDVGMEDVEFRVLRSFFKKTKFISVAIL
jgi:hypothetical protein